MKNKSLMMSGLLLSMVDSLNSDFRREVSRPVSVNAGDAEKNKEAYYRKKGLTRFLIDGKEVWARDIKNAQRKAKQNEN